MARCLTGGASPLTRPNPEGTAVVAAAVVRVVTVEAAVAVVTVAAVTVVTVVMAVVVAAMAAAVVVMVAVAVLAMVEVVLRAVAGGDKHGDVDDGLGCSFVSWSYVLVL